MLSDFSPEAFRVQRAGRGSMGWLNAKCYWQLTTSDWKLNPCLKILDT